VKAEAQAIAAQVPVPRSLSPKRERQGRACRLPWAEPPRRRWLLAATRAIRHSACCSVGVDWGACGATRRSRSHRVRRRKPGRR
jgi:hypothetical protein